MREMLRSTEMFVYVHIATTNISRIITPCTLMAMFSLFFKEAIPRLLMYSHTMVAVHVVIFITDVYIANGKTRYKELIGQ